jgi:hypothetical protein
MNAKAESPARLYPRRNRRKIAFARFDLKKTAQAYEIACFRQLDLINWS